jgi:hypothetical protein
MVYENFRTTRLTLKYERFQDEPREYDSTSELEPSSFSRFFVCNEKLQKFTYSLLRVCPSVCSHVNNSRTSGRMFIKFAHIPIFAKIGQKWTFYMKICMRFYVDPERLSDRKTFRTKAVEKKKRST